MTYNRTSIQFLFTASSKYKCHSSSNINIFVFQISLEAVYKGVSICLTTIPSFDWLYSSSTTLFYTHLPALSSAHTLAPCLTHTLSLFNVLPLWPIPYLYKNTLYNNHSIFILHTYTTPQPNCLKKKKPSSEESIYTTTHCHERHTTRSGDEKYLPHCSPIPVTPHVFTTYSHNTTIYPEAFTFYIHTHAHTRSSLSFPHLFILYRLPLNIELLIN